MLDNLKRDQNTSKINVFKLCGILFLTRVQNPSLILVAFQEQNNPTIEKCISDIYSGRVSGTECFQMSKSGFWSNTSRVSGTECSECQKILARTCSLGRPPPEFLVALHVQFVSKCNKKLIWGISGCVTRSQSPRM